MGAIISLLSVAKGSSTSFRHPSCSPLAAATALLCLITVVAMADALASPDAYKLGPGDQILIEVFGQIVEVGSRCFLQRAIHAVNDGILSLLSAQIGHLRDSLADLIGRQRVAIKPYINVLIQIADVDWHRRCLLHVRLAG